MATSFFIVVNASENEWRFGDYGVNMTGDRGGWREIFNSQALFWRLTIGKPGSDPVRPKRWPPLHQSAKWSVLMFAREKWKPRLPQTPHDYPLRRCASRHRPDHRTLRMASASPNPRCAAMPSSFWSFSW
jgi:hypothetical protein